MSIISTRKCIIASIIMILICSGCGGMQKAVNNQETEESMEAGSNPEVQYEHHKLSPGALPDAAGKALDAAIALQYCSPLRFPAKALRMSGMWGKSSQAYYEIESNWPGFEFPAREGGELTLRPVSPEKIQIRGRGDGTDITILNYEELELEVFGDAILGGYIAPEGSRLFRENGAWVLEIH